MSICKELIINGMENVTIFEKAKTNQDASLKEYCKEKSNSKLYYYFMTITPLRIIYDGVRSMKRILHNGGRNG